jgi:hypothetical protein
MRNVDWDSDRPDRGLRVVGGVCVVGTRPVKTTGLGGSGRLAQAAFAARFCARQIQGRRSPRMGPLE